MRKAVMERVPNNHLNVHSIIVIAQACVEALYENFTLDDSIQFINALRWIRNRNWNTSVLLK